MVAGPDAGSWWFRLAAILTSTYVKLAKGKDTKHPSGTPLTGTQSPTFLACLTDQIHFVEQLLRPQSSRKGHAHARDKHYHGHLA